MADEDCRFTAIKTEMSDDSAPQTNKSAVTGCEDYQISADDAHGSDVTHGSNSLNVPHNVSKISFSDAESVSGSHGVAQVSFNAGSANSVQDNTSLSVHVAIKCEPGTENTEINAKLPGSSSSIHDNHASCSDTMIKTEPLIPISQIKAESEQEPSEIAPIFQNKRTESSPSDTRPTPVLLFASDEAASNAACAADTNHGFATVINVKRICVTGNKKRRVEANVVEHEVYEYEDESSSSDGQHLEDTVDSDLGEEGESESERMTDNQVKGISTHTRKTKEGNKEKYNQYLANQTNSGRLKNEKFEEDMTNEYDQTDLGKHELNYAILRKSCKQEINKYNRERRRKQKEKNPEKYQRYLKEQRERSRLNRQKLKEELTKKVPDPKILEEYERTKMLARIRQQRRRKGKSDRTDKQE